MKTIHYLVLASLIVIALFMWPFFLKVDIKCQSQYGQCNQEIINDISIYKWHSLYSARNGVAKSLKQNFLVSDYSTQFKLPNILQVNILVKKPSFTLYNKNLNQAALTDLSGEVLSIAQNTTLPVVYVNQNLPKPGESVGDKNLFALKLISGLNDMYQIKEGIIDNDSLVVDLQGQIRVIFPLEGDSQVLLGSLKLIYLKIQGDLAGKFSQIDLRFKNPVLR